MDTTVHTSPLHVPQPGSPDVEVTKGDYLDILLLFPDCLNKLFDIGFIGEFRDITILPRASQEIVIFRSCYGILEEARESMVCHMAFVL